MVVNTAGASPVAATAAANGPVANLPSVTGLDLTSARETLLQAGFQYDVRYAQQSTNNGTIVAQDPQAGQGPQGATVDDHPLGLG